MKNFAHAMSALVLASLAPIAVPAAAAPRDDMDVYTACILKFAPAEARELLGTTVRSAEEGSVVSHLVNHNKRCLDETDLTKVDTGDLRGRIAETLIAGDQTRLAALRTAAPMPAKTPAPTEGRALLAGIADCLVASKPDVALRLIRTPRGSYAEREALGAFGDATKICTPADTKFRLEIADVRNHVADALYRRSGASAGAVTTGAAE